MISSEELNQVTHNIIPRDADVHPCLVNDAELGELLGFYGKILGQLRHFYLAAAAFLVGKPQLAPHSPRNYQPEKYFSF